MQTRLVIVGGGSAGWITACLLAAERGEQVQVTLVESPDIPIIGVGEGTWPSMRMTMQRIGLDEADLVRECEATFKQGTGFRGWSTDTGDDIYYHPFSLPADYSTLNLADVWLRAGDSVPFAEFVTPQAKVISAGLAPKQRATPPYAFNVNYGYHFDAGKFAGLLQRHGVANLGVRHVRANVDEIESAENGDVLALRLNDGSRLEGDLFVDCTGQRGLLIGGHFGIDSVPVGDVLLNDRAIAVQVPYEHQDDPIASVTRATAQEAGWIWDIGLQTRRGIGYVHSSQYADEEVATETLSRYIRKTAPGIDITDLGFRTITFESGYRERFWVNNCVAIGLSAGFVEPLEASALALIEQSASTLCSLLPANREIMVVAANRFNEKMRYHWARIVDFLKLHYCISNRTGSQYWQDCRSVSSCPDGLREKLVLWEQQSPWHEDAPRVDELFPSASYQYVLYGMGFRPSFEGYKGITKETSRRADAIVRENEQKVRQLLGALPTNRELIDSLTT